MSEDPPLTHGVLPKRANPTRIDLYVPDRDLPWVREVQRALLRDGSSVSAWVLAQLRAWWDIHKPGNPQTGMERFVDPSVQPSLSPPDHGELRWERLNTMTNEQLQERLEHVKGKLGCHDEIVEIGIMLHHRRSHGCKPGCLGRSTQLSKVSAGDL